MKLSELVKSQDCSNEAEEVPVVTYVSTAAESDDQQQQWPEATHQRRGGEALSPAATASSSPHARPCRSRRGERTNFQKARRRSVRASSLLLRLPLLPHSSLLPLHLGCAGALKHSCCAEWNAGRRQRDAKDWRERKYKSIWPHFYFPQVQIRGPRDLTCAPSATGLFPMRSCDKHARSHLPLSSSPSTDFPSTPPPSLSPPSPPCPLNKSIQNQPNPAAVGKPAPRTRTHTRTNRERERLNTIKKPVIKVIKL